MFAGRRQLVFEHVATFENAAVFAGAPFRSWSMLVLAEFELQQALEQAGSIRDTLLALGLTHDMVGGKDTQ